MRGLVAVSQCKISMLLAHELCWWLSLFVYLTNITKEKLEQIESNTLTLMPHLGSFSVKFNSQIVFEFLLCTGQFAGFFLGK